MIPQQLAAGPAARHRAVHLTGQKNRKQPPLPASQWVMVGIEPTLRPPNGGILNILYVLPIPQQIQISVDQPYAGPAASCCGIIGTHSI
jgi:hypothetical protein